MVKSHTIVNHYWNPCQPARDWIEGTHFFKHVTSNDTLLKDPWCFDHLTFEGDFEDNISHLNPKINELTSAWLAWRNKKELGIDDSDYIGLCHYRRFFKQEQLNRALDDMSPADIISMPPCGLGLCVNIEHQYRMAHVGQDWEVFHKSVKDNWQDYDHDIWNNWSNLPLLVFPCNLLTLKSPLFDNWMEDMFTVILPLVSAIDLSERDNYQKRALGFLSERFTSLWTYTQYVKYKARVVMCPIEFHEDWKPDAAWDRRGSFEQN